MEEYELIGFKNYKKENENYLRFRFYNNCNEIIKNIKISFSDKEYELSGEVYPNNSIVFNKAIHEYYDITEDNVNITYDKENLDLEHSVLDMTKGSIPKIMFKFSLPIMLSMLFQQLYSIVDSIIVGNYLGKTSLAAVASSGSLIFLFISFFLGTSLGAGVLISKYFGAKDYHNMSRAIHTNILLSLFASIVLMVAGVLLIPTILRLMNTDPIVLPEAIEYFQVYFSGAISIVMYNVFSGTLQAVGNSRRPFIYLVISSITNVILDLLFIGYFKLGVGYAALATMLSNAISASLCFLHLLKKGNIYHINLFKLRVHKDMAKDIVRYGLPTGIQNSVIGFANVMVQSSINLFGENAMAGCGSYSKVEAFVFLPINAFSNAISTFISQNLGAKEYDRAKKGARFALINVMILAEIIGVLFFILAPYLISLFNSDPDIVQYGVKQARTCSLLFFLLALSHGIASVARGSGKAIVPMIVMLLCWCIIRVAYIKIIMNFVEEIGFIFVAYPMTWTLSSIIYVIYFFKSNWVHNLDNKTI